MATTKRGQWKATHKITYKPPSGDRWLEAEWFVMLTNDGAAYTRSEWDANITSDWERDRDGKWWFQGSPSPGLGTVDIAPVK